MINVTIDKSKDRQIYLKSNVKFIRSDVKIDKFI